MLFQEESERERRESEGTVTVVVRHLDSPLPPDFHIISSIAQDENSNSLLSLCGIEPTTYVPIGFDFISLLSFSLSHSSQGLRSVPAGYLWMSCLRVFPTAYQAAYVLSSPSQQAQQSRQQTSLCRLSISLDIVVVRKRQMRVRVKSSR